MPETATVSAPPEPNRQSRRGCLFFLLAFVVVVVVLVALPIWLNRQVGLDEELIVSARLGDIKDVRRLLQQGANPNARDLPIDARPFLQRLWDRLTGMPDHDTNARTVLSCATDAKNPEPIIRLLLEKGANIKADDASKLPAIIWASRGGHLSTVRMLLDAGADPNARDESGFTPLQGAVLSDNVALVKLLLERGAKPGGFFPFGGTLTSQARSLEMRDLMAKIEAAASAQATPSSALAPHQKDLRKSLEAEYSKRVRLIYQDDLTGYGNTVAEDMVYVTGDAIRRNKKAYLNAVKLMLSVTEPADTISYKITDLRTSGNETAVGVFQSIESENRQRKIKTRLELTSEETWVKMPAGWQVKQVAERSATQFKNGKKVYPK